MRHKYKKSVQYNLPRAETIKVKYLPGAHKLEQINIGDWIDLYTYEDLDIEPNSFKLVNLGVAIQLPIGYEALLVPRSSTFMKYGLIQTNHIGIIDESYCGNSDIWKVPVLNMSSNKGIHIPKDTRLCQFRIIQHQPTIQLLEVQKLENSDRGGFGSTGA